MGEFRVDVDQRKRRAHQAGNVNRAFAQPEHWNIEQFAHFVQPGIEDVANQEGVVAFALGADAIFQHLGGVEEFEVAILLGNGCGLSPLTEISVPGAAAEATIRFSSWA